MDVKRGICVNGTKVSSVVPIERTLAQWAVLYAKRGLEVFPLHPDKTPATEHGMNDASSDVEVVAAWWSRAPEALIGCRVPEDVIILDVDPRHGGDDTWDALIHEFAHDLPLEPARWHASGRGDGGRHRWYQRPAGPLSTKALDEWAREHKVGHQAGERRWSAGIDLLHHGHRYTVLPPSPHAVTGRPYSWGAEGTPGPAPIWLAELLRPPAATVTQLPMASERMSRLDLGDSIADWFSERSSWRDILAGWYLIGGNGDEDGSKWRHPNASAANSATVRHGCLFVYSPNTDFEPTEPNDPKGYTRFHGWAVLEFGGDMSAAGRRARELKDGPRDDPATWPGFVTSPTVLVLPPKAEEPAHISRTHLLDWPLVWSGERDAEQWLASPLLPRGRLVSLVAGAKSGKSLLALDVCASLAIGASVLGQPAGEPIDVLYLDYEMTLDDLVERLEAMDYYGNPFEHFHYGLLPSLPPLDTTEGGEMLLAVAQALGVELVVVDTRQRALSGMENDADIVRAAYRCSFAPLKAVGICVWRLDHSGKDVEKGARGSSALRDDVDVEWKLTKTEGGIRLDHHGTSRVSWVPQTVELRIETEPVLRHLLANPSTAWPAGTKACADRLDAINAPVDISRRKAVELLKAASFEGAAGSSVVVGAAIKYRKQSLAVAMTTQKEPEPLAISQEPRTSSEPRSHTAPELAEPTPEPPGTTTRNVSYQESPVGTLGSVDPEPLGESEHDRLLREILE